MQKKFSNAQIVKIVDNQNDSIGRAFRSKKLPMSLLYAMNKNMRPIVEAHEAYELTKAALCEEYGMKGKINLATCENKEFVQRINELLDAENEINIHMVNSKALESCGNGSYDPLTFNELARISWMLEGDD